IILDIIENSMDKDYIMMSEDIYKALFDLKKFNYENIYSKIISDKELEYYRNGMNMIFNNYLKDLDSNNKDSLIYRMFLNNKSDNYINNNSNKRIVIDFIAGMTDDFFLNEVKKACKNN
ncbi:MAG: phosphohydrolase, partial [Romboutsia sp.]|nr:phosphohydrolase [Romboutsia sp.]